MGRRYRCHQGVIWTSFVPLACSETSLLRALLERASAGVRGTGTQEGVPDRASGQGSRTGLPQR